MQIMQVKPKRILKTLRVRIKERHAGALRAMAIEVNQVWNRINALTRDAYLEPIPGFGWVACGDWLSAFDVNNSLNGYTKQRKIEVEQLAGVNSQTNRSPKLTSAPTAYINMFTVQEVSAVHAKARNQYKRSQLRWRCSFGARRNLGWIPFRQGALTYRAGQMRYAGIAFKVWDSYGLDKCGKFLAGSFAEDARGRWYLNICVEVAARTCSSIKSVGIDLGLKDTATCSDGLKLEAGRFYRKLEPAIAAAQRAGKKALVRALCAKARNQRKDALHKFTTILANEYGAIFIGNVSSTKLAKTPMAKSVYDAGLGMLKTMLKYKAIERSAWYEEVNESYTTQTCSSCRQIGASSPKGRAGLGIREWTCVGCGATHDRDVNAAKNILALGHERLAAGIPVLQGGEDVKTI